MMSWNTRTRLIWHTLRNHKLLIVYLLIRRLLNLIHFRLYLLCYNNWLLIRNLFYPIIWYFLESWKIILIHIYVRFYRQFSFFRNWYWWLLYSILLVQLNLMVLLIYLFLFWIFDRYVFFLLYLWFILGLHKIYKIYITKFFRKISTNWISHHILYFLY